jgi:hypothetical protein
LFPGAVEKQLGCFSDGADERSGRHASAFGADPEAETPRCLILDRSKDDWGVDLQT